MHGHTNIKMGRLVFILSKSHNKQQQLKQSVDNSLCQDNNHGASYMQIRAAYLLQILNEIFKNFCSTMVQSVTNLTLQRHGQCMWNLQHIKWYWDRCSPSSGIPGGGSNSPPPKFRSFDKVEPDCKLSGKCLALLFQHPN